MICIEMIIFDRSVGINRWGCSLLKITWLGWGDHRLAHRILFPALWSESSWIWNYMVLAWPLTHTIFLGHSPSVFLNEDVKSNPDVDVCISGALMDLINVGLWDALRHWAWKHKKDHYLDLLNYCLAYSSRKKTHKTKTNLHYLRYL